KPVSVLMPVKLGCEISTSAPLAARATAVSRLMNCCTCWRSISEAAYTLADDAIPIIFGLMSPAASSSRSVSGVGWMAPLARAAAGGGCAETAVLAAAGHEVHSPVDGLLEGGSVVIEDRRRSAVQNFLIVLGVDEECRSGLGHGAEPVAREHVREG